MSGVLALDGAVRRYDWGSPTAIPRMLGTPPDGRPVAELWLGAHPDDPSAVPEHGTTLDRLIAADPAGVLGPQVVDRFGARLPFLLKILAAEKALSIQVHPDLHQARAGYEAEDAAGIAQNAAERNYRDRNHKPELLRALTDFEALCGFRPVAQIATLFDAVAVPELRPLREALEGPQPLRSTFTALLTSDGPRPLVDEVAARVDRLAAVDPGAARAVELTAADAPGDIGVLLTLLLNHVRLRPGEALFLPAGNVHAYLRGTGIEIMANSDNVLRCGLTSKHVDVQQLLQITDFTELGEPRWRPDPVPHGQAYRPPVEDFALLSLRPGQAAVPLPDAAAGIVLCTDGAVTVRCADTSATLGPGRAAFVRADAGAVRVTGPGTVFVATTGSRNGPPET